MRKIIISICSLMLSLTIMLGGCSCAAPIVLSFLNEFNGGENNVGLSTNYKETLTYDVKYATEDLSIKKSPDLAEEDLPKFENGKYVMEFKGNVILPEEIKSDLDFPGNIYKLSTIFSIDVTCDGKVYNDMIITDCYFFDSGSAFAPIYSNSKIKNTLFSLVRVDGKDVPKGEQAVYNYIVNYNKDEYVIDSYAFEGTQEEIADFDLTNFDLSLLKRIGKSEEYGYTPKELIDNNTLLFAIRNMNIKLESSKTLPVVSPIYGKSSDLTVRNYSETTMSFENNPLIFNGESLSASVKVKNVLFSRSGSNNTGTPQNLSIQLKEEGNPVPYRALPVKYANSLTLYGGIKCMGALVYNLKSVDFVK